MKEMQDIKDDQIRIIGKEENKHSKPRNSKIWFIISVLIGIISIIGMVYIFHIEDKTKYSENEVAFFEPYKENDNIKEEKIRQIGENVDSLVPSFVEIRDTLINDINLRIYIPHNGEASLQLGNVNENDTSIMFSAQAADIRGDNGDILGAFVLKGEPLAWGLSKKGFCAIIDGNITIGVADNSPLFEQATERGGYFFRQYPLVKNGIMVENKPKGKSIRRGLCERAGEILIVESMEKESFHDFAQALADLKINNAVYLVGGGAFGWAIDKDGEKHILGNKNYPKIRRKKPQNLNQIVWRKKNYTK